MANNQSTQTLNVDVTVKAETLEDDLFKIYSKLFDGVSRDDLECKELKGGYVNSILKVSTKKDSTKKSLVFRTFGMKLNAAEFNKEINQIRAQSALEQSDDPSKGEKNGAAQPNPPENFDINKLFFNRDTEFEVMNVVSKFGLCEPVYAKYNNGLCYGYTDGVTLNGALMLTNDFLNEMATKMARFHTIRHSIQNIKSKTHFERMNSEFGPMLEHMISVVNGYIEANKNDYPYNNFPNLLSLVDMEKTITGLLTEIGFGEITFCHNDTNQKNVIWNPQERTLGFIDFELAMNNYAILEIGQLFFCYTGHFLVDFDSELFPNDDYRKRFLRKYLEEKNKSNKIEMNKDEFEAELIKLFHQTNLASLFFMLRIIIMTPFFDVNPGFFKNDELDLARTQVKHYCGRFGYKIYELLAEIKDDILKKAEGYAAARRCD